MSRILLAPMEGLADPLMRNVLTAVGGYDWGICEFIRVTESVLPNRTFLRTCPELNNASLTDSGTPMRVQLLGSDPHFMAANARRLVKHRPAGVDINFGCPAPTVFRHRGGSALLGEPQLLHDIVSAVRAEVPADIPFTAKMRLGIADSSLAVDCAQAIAAGGADELIVHGRTKVDGYKPPARWAQIDRVRAAVDIPIIANGEVWTVADFRQCQLESGCSDVMIGRGALADPLLPRKVRGEATGGWEELLPSVATYWRGVRERVLPVHAGGRLKQWLMLLRRHYPQAEALYQQLRPVKAAEDIDRLLVDAGVLDAIPDKLLLAA
ncbi:tRNA-dihydrouridine synthase [uncultured Dechloromonas sp.]|uniref:tRNA dihydrouridine synthase n=1 Tax=uncultured Dechloromonas sp. TaxID=171719 RepID=UPI0025F3FC07|nr:tRNA-dihydrouridine synthase [uncultured Dechloromonas sp.]